MARKHSNKTKCQNKKLSKKMIDHGRDCLLLHNGSCFQLSFIPYFLFKSNTSYIKWIYCAMANHSTAIHLTTSYITHLGDNSFPMRIIFSSIHEIGLNFPAWKCLLKRKSIRVMVANLFKPFKWIVSVFLFVISATLALKSNYLVDWESSFWRLMMYYGK